MYPPRRRGFCPRLLDRRVDHERAVNAEATLTARDLVRLLEAKAERVMPAADARKFRAVLRGARARPNDGLPRVTIDDPPLPFRTSRRVQALRPAQMRLPL